MFCFRWLFPQFQLSWIGSAIGAAAGLAGSLIGADSQADANSANAAQSQKQMDFQREMSNTGYQRAVADLRAAGLSPMLTYSQGPASAPSGSQAVIQPKFTPSSFGTAAQAAQASAQIRQLSATTDNTKADTINKLATSENISADTALKMADARYRGLQSASEGYRPQLLINQAQQAKSSARATDELLFPRMDSLRAGADLSRASAGQIESQRVLMKKLMETGWTKHWAPYLLDAFRSGR